MLRIAFCYVLGVLLFHRMPVLPGMLWLIPQGLALLLLALGGQRLRGPARCRLLPVALMGAAVLLGFAWAHGYALHAVPPALTPEQPRFGLSLTGRITGLPEVRGELTRFVVETSALLVDDEPLDGVFRFRLSWRDAPTLSPGDRWQLQARMRHAHGYASPGSWDYEGWLYHQGVRYTGYVTNGERIEDAVQGRCCTIDRWRDSIRTGIDTMPLSVFARGVVGALVVADRSGLDAQHKAMFRDTGTSHLMAVSGLHIGLISGATILLVGFAWRHMSTLCERLPSRFAAAGAGLVAAVFYAGLAGFGLPTQRALIMLAVLAFGIVSRRETRVGHGLALAAVLVLLWHPPSIVAAGFWLSFGAVATIIATLAWTRGRPPWLRAVFVQVGVTLGLWPVLLLYGLPVSAISPFANLVLVPLFGLLIVPWSLLVGVLSAIAPAFAAVLSTPLGWLLDKVQQGLMSVAAAGIELPAYSGAGIALVALAIGLLLSPPGMPLRLAALPLLLLPWLPRQASMDEGDFHFHLLDVGQGLSAVVETRHHVLVYDTGPAYLSGFSAAEAVVVPFLRHRGRNGIDRLIASHGDSDHAGGMAAMLRAMPVTELLSGEPDRVGFGARACIAGQSWEWDGVRFRILHPATGARSAGNNASCVLRVENRAGAVLVTGDIEAAVERRLVRGGPQDLRAEVVVAAHHGSQSSSSPGFVTKVAPRHVLFASGWANRYGFPKPAVAARWTAADAVLHDTARDGTLSFIFPANGQLAGPSAYRRVSQRFWRHDAGSAGVGLAVSSGD